VLNFLALLVQKYKYWYKRTNIVAPDLYNLLGAGVGRHFERWRRQVLNLGTSSTSKAGLLVLKYK
jgi:hypothetical protein